MGRAGSQLSGARPAPATFGNAEHSQPSQAATLDTAAIRNDTNFRHLRSSVKRFIFPAGAVFLSWYFLYVLLAAYVPEFMSRPVAGAINMGLVFGLLQFVSTVLITIAYLRYHKTRIEPRINRLRDKAGVQR